MSKKLTNIIKEENLKKKPVFRANNYDFSSPKFIERMKRVREIQRAIRGSIIYTRYDLDKASSPYSRQYSQ